MYSVTHTHTRAHTLYLNSTFISLCSKRDGKAFISVFKLIHKVHTIQLTGNLMLARSKLVSTHRVLANCENRTHEGGANTREYVRVRALELDARSLSVQSDRSTTVSGRFFEGLVVDRAV